MILNYAAKVFQRNKAELEKNDKTINTYIFKIKESEDIDYSCFRFCQL